MDDRFILNGSKLIRINLNLDKDEYYDVVSIPEGITEIGEEAMTDYDGTECMLSFPKTLKRIGKSAFFGASSAFCDGDLFLEEGIEEIGDNAFCDCGLSTITLPQGLKKIGAWFFAPCLER